MIDLDGRIFGSAANSASGDVGSDTIFHYHQNNNIVWATYSGGKINFGTLLANVTSEDTFEMRYQHIDDKGAFKTGKCRTVVETNEQGKIVLNETWEWTSGDHGSGKSTLLEI